MATKKGRPIVMGRPERVVSERAVELDGSSANPGVGLYGRGPRGMRCRVCAHVVAFLEPEGEGLCKLWPPEGKRFLLDWPACGRWVLPDLRIEISFEGGSGG